MKKRKKNYEIIEGKEHYLQEGKKKEGMQKREKRRKLISRYKRRRNFKKL